MFRIPFLLLVLLAVSCKQSPDTAVLLQGLEQPVEVYRDPYGLNHIYTQNQRDLFFAQGYLAARDRLFQFEIWRRQATGTLAEILGPRALDRDIGARLLRARVDMGAEMRHYHPDGEQIITSGTHKVRDGSAIEALAPATAGTADRLDRT